MTAQPHVDRAAPGELDGLDTESSASRQHWIDTGHYSEGRWGWLLDRVRPLPSPIVTPGAQGIWTPSEDLLDQVAAQVELDR